MRISLPSNLWYGILIIILVMAGHAQDGRAPVVSGFAVFGNKVTDPSIILRELTIHVGDTLSTEELLYCRERIYSLGLFNRVEIHVPPMDSTVVIIEVEERWYIYPIPIVRIVDRDLSKWQYGLGIVHQNFRGWNEKLFGGFALGYNPWVNVNYSNPWIFGESELFFSSAVGYQKVQNKSAVSQGQGPNFDEIHYYTGHSLGKRFDPYRSMWLSAAYDYVEVSDNRAGRTASVAGLDRYLSFGIGAKHDTRNLAEYPTEGIYTAVSLTKKGIGFGAVDHVRTSIDARAYKTIAGVPSIGLRLFTRLASGPVVPNYEHEFFGFGERLRGHFTEVIEGDNIAGAFVEVRIPIVREVFIRVPEIPVEQFATWKFGVYAAVFADAGTTWEKNDRPRLTGMPAGYGLGLHVLFPYSVVGRVDRAWNEKGVGEWIFDVGASF